MNRIRHLVLTSSVALALGLSGALAAAPTVSTYGGNTTVELDSGFTGALDSLGVGLGLTGFASASGNSVSFQIPAGEIDMETAAGQIVHNGGITLTAGALTVTLSSFIIDTTGDSPVLTGLVKANGDLLFRAPLFDAALPEDLTLPLQSLSRTGLIRLSGIDLTLTAEAADLLNAVFEVDAFEAGLAIGTAGVSTRTLRLR